MKKNKLFILIITALIAMLFLISCNMTAEDEKKEEDDEQKTESNSYDAAKLTGCWKSSFTDGFEIIAGTPNIFRQYDNEDKDISFAGEIVNCEGTDAEGFITIKITDGGTWFKTVNEYYLIRWQNYNPASIKESCPFKAGGQSTMPTASGAEAEFTIANKYFTFYGDYLKQ